MNYINFQRLFDPDSFVSNMTVNSKQLDRNETVWFNVSKPLSEIPEKFWSGNRLYVEIGWSADEHPPRFGGNSKLLIAHYIDTISPRKQFNQRTYSNGTNWSMFALICGAILIGIGILLVVVKKLSHKTYQ